MAERRRKGPKDARARSLAIILRDSDDDGAGDDDKAFG